MERINHEKKIYNNQHYLNNSTKNSKIRDNQKNNENGESLKTLSSDLELSNKDNNTTYEDSNDNNTKYNISLFPINYQKQNNNYNDKFETPQEKSNITKNIQKSKLDIYNSDHNNNFLSKVGIKNLNNNDYINSILQCLINIQKIKEFFISNGQYFEKMVNICPLSYAISRSIINLNQSYNRNNNESYKISPLLKLLEYLNPSFKRGSSKDPIDLLIFLFIRMNEELNDLNKTNDRTIINDPFTLFNWVSEKEKKCLECKKKSIIKQNFYTFDLDYKNIINKNISIIDCLNNYSEKKILFNVYCCQCKRKTLFSENVSSIKKYPEIFIFVVKDLINEKEKIEIKIEKNLNIENNNYELKSIVVFDKKYVAYCQSFNYRMWYEYRDEEIKQIKFEEIIRINQEKIRPVIFFYEMK